MTAHLKPMNPIGLNLFDIPQLEKWAPDPQDEPISATLSSWARRKASTAAGLHWPPSHLWPRFSCVPASGSRALHWARPRLWPISRTPRLRTKLFECGGKYFLTCANALGDHSSSKAIDTARLGARGLRFESMLLDTMFDLPSLDGVEEVMILSARYFSPCYSLRLLDVILSHPRILI